MAYIMIQSHTGCNLVAPWAWGINIWHTSNPSAIPLCHGTTFRKPYLYFTTQRGPNLSQHFQSTLQSGSYLRSPQLKEIHYFIRQSPYLAITFGLCLSSIAKCDKKLSDRLLIICQIKNKWEVASLQVMLVARIRVPLF